MNSEILAVSMLKRENGETGAGEEAGLRLGDIIFGVNFIPTREGSRTLIKILRRETKEKDNETESNLKYYNFYHNINLHYCKDTKKKKILYIQAWRCHQLCSENIPGHHFPRCDDILVQAYSLVRTSVFTEWEKWNFIEIMLT